MGNADHRTLPELSPPPLPPGTIQRPRLFRHLDRVPGGTVLWLWGPPGCGKTTLLAAWLAHRDEPALWHTLSAAPSRPLPVQSPTGHGSPSILVIDNLHYAEDPQLAGLAPWLAEHAPNHRVVLISRSEPPADFANALAAAPSAPGTPTLQRLGWNRLRMDRAEVARMVQAAGQWPDRGQSERIHRISGGLAVTVSRLLHNTGPSTGSTTPATDGPPALATPRIAPVTAAPVPGYPVAIHALGPFRIHTPNGPLPPFRKPPRRPLELVKMLLAAGPRGVTEIDLTDTLWPDADGDAAQRALATTLHRLRTLLVARNAVLREAGWLRLNAQQVWVDAWALMAAIDTTLGTAASGADQPETAGLGATEVEIGGLGATASHHAVAAMGAGRPPGHPVLHPARADRLYRLLMADTGPLLAADGTPPWLTLPRKRLQNHVITALLRLGAHYAEQSHWPPAEAAYQRALALAPESAAAQQGLERIRKARGHQGDTPTHS